MSAGHGGDGRDRESRAIPTGVGLEASQAPGSDVPLANLADRAPVEIDTVLSRLDGDYHGLSGRLRVVLDRVHRAIGDVKLGYGRRQCWERSDDDAVRMLAAAIEKGTVGEAYDAPRTLDTYNTLAKAANANRVEADRLEAEYERRRWSRFIVVQHVHSGYWCAGGTVRHDSVRHWLPELSGRSEAEAIAELAERAHMLCTHCFPNAPVITPREDPTTCTCKRYDRTKPMRSGYAYGNYGTCAECGARAALTRMGNLRKHQRPA